MILLIENDALLAQLYQDTLSDAGYEVALACDAAEALELLVANEVEVIVLDLLLRLTNGVQLLHELQSYPQAAGIPVIIQSGIHPARCGLSKAIWRQYGVVEYLHKATARPQHLVRAVRTALNEAAN